MSAQNNGNKFVQLKLEFFSMKIEIARVLPEKNNNNTKRERKKNIKMAAAAEIFRT